MQYFFTALIASLLLSFSVQASPLSVGSGHANDSARALPTVYLYTIDCNKYPNVCQNQCFYVNCHVGSWEIHVQRTPASRRDSECSGYNRCSHGRQSGAIPGGWANNPQSGWTCDEQPKSSTMEGGLGSATRCMPGSENSSEGSVWGNFINGNTAATGKKKLADGATVTIALVNSKNVGYCAGKSACAGPSTPPATNDGPRQR